MWSMVRQILGWLAGMCWQSRGGTYMNQDRKSTRLDSRHSQKSRDSYFFFNDTATTEIYTLSLHDALPIYVEYGAADIGVAGRDVLAEQGRDLYEPLDFKFGFCRMVLAEPKELRAGDAPSKWTHIRVATKFSKITENYFKRKGIQVEIIKLYGSIELAPLVGLSERIVDLVSTGRTLKENGLVEVEEIMKVTARLIVNRASLKTKYERVSYIIEELRSIIS